MNMADKRGRLTLKMKEYIIEEKERKKTINEIIKSVSTKFKLQPSRRAIFRTLADKEKILMTLRNNPKDCREPTTNR